MAAALPIAEAKNNVQFCFDLTKLTYIKQKEIEYLFDDSLIKGKPSRSCSISVIGDTRKMTLQIDFKIAVDKATPRILLKESAESDIYKICNLLFDLNIPPSMKIEYSFTLNPSDKSAVKVNGMLYKEELGLLSGGNKRVSLINKSNEEVFYERGLINNQISEMIFDIKGALLEDNSAPSPSAAATPVAPPRMAMDSMKIDTATSVSAHLSELGVFAARSGAAAKTTQSTMLKVDPSKFEGKRFKVNDTVKRIYLQHGNLINPTTIEIQKDEKIVFVK